LLPLLHLPHLLHIESVPSLLCGELPLQFRMLRLHLLDRFGV
jgi:hypothetical protein